LKFAPFLIVRVLFICNIKCNWSVNLDFASSFKNTIVHHYYTQFTAHFCPGQTAAHNVSFDILFVFFLWLIKM